MKSDHVNNNKSRPSDLKSQYVNVCEERRVCERANSTLGVVSITVSHVNMMDFETEWRTPGELML